MIERRMTLVSLSGKEREVTMDVRPVRNGAGRIISMFMLVRPRMNGTGALLSS